jgi:outer membrane immunogenic protein
MRRNIGWALASVVSLGIGGLGAASAADLPLKARPLPVVAAYNWTGCYIGANVGGKWARTGDVVNIPATAASPASTLDLGRDTSDTFIGGGQVGCNWQTGKVVFGIEGDADAQRWRRTQVLAGVLPPLFVPGDIFQLTSTWQASIRGRIGYAWDRTLLYATGGVAFTDVNAFTNWIPTGIFPGTITSQTKTLVGATVGAGVEYAFTDNFTVGVEGRYTWYGSQTFNAGLLSTAFVPGILAPGGFFFAPTTRSVNVETAEVMLKANWKFNSGPVVARY